MWIMKTDFIISHFFMNVAMFTYTRLHVFLFKCLRQYSKSDNSIRLPVMRIALVELFKLKLYLDLQQV